MQYKQPEPFKLTDGLYYVGVHDPELRVFDIIMSTEFGTTYNAYVIKGNSPDGKVALAETAKAKYTDDYIAALNKVTDIEKVSYLIVSHTEPDHVGSIEALLDINPSLTIVATPCAIGYLKHIVNRDFHCLPVKSGLILDLGGKHLSFYQLPNLHWPDTMFTYIQEDRALITCDSFGSHYCHPEVLRSAVTDYEGYMRATKYYFDNIIGPFKRPYMVNALKAIEPLQLDWILTGHGPVHDSHIDELLDIYKEWCAAPESDGRRHVAIPYVSAYGYTKQLAAEITRGVESAGDIAVSAFDLVETDAVEAAAAIDAADGVLFGTPTILGEALAPIWDLATRLYPPIHGGKLGSAFGSYGWSGEGVPHIIERLKQARLKVLDGYKVRFKPNGGELSDAFEFGYNFGCVLLDKENDRAQQGKTGKQLKCLVCGAIMPEGTTVCPVCGVGPDQFISIDAPVVEFRRDTDRRFIIVGAGIAGVSAAAAIRTRDDTASIVLLDVEEGLPYNRPMLTKNMFSALTADQLAIYDEEWFEQQRIVRVSAQRVQSLDTAAKTVRLESGAELMYDACVLALGASSFVPPIKGADAGNVFAIRSLGDVRRLEAAAKSAKSAVVIGGGVLGLEAAWELRKIKMDVTVVEALPRLLDRKVAATASDMLAGITEKTGIRLLLGAMVAAVESDGGKVSGVRLGDGTVIPADIVVFSTGIVPNVKVAQESGIAVERGVVVDERMRTSAEGVYACGDCAIYGGMRYGLWAEAASMGDVAGANAVGDGQVYVRALMPVTLNALGTALYAVGDTGSDASKAYKTVEFRDNAKGTLAAYHFLGQRLMGVTLLGDASGMRDAQEQVESGAAYATLFTKPER
ncbi:oxidoreductase [Clostridia bacterium]|nr:oxidoreductase [Clostridia bacterium]